MDVSLRRVSSSDDVITLATMADQIWHEFFVSILSEDQIDYMVDKFQSAKAMMQQMVNQGYEYYFILADGRLAGYTGIKNEEHRLFLSKLYLRNEFRGMHIASIVFAQIKDICSSRGKQSIYLTVNKYNEHAISVYKSFGMKQIQALVTDIGEGYVMDDYVMEVMMESKL